MIESENKKTEPPDAGSFDGGRAPSPAAAGERPVRERFGLHAEQHPFFFASQTFGRPGPRQSAPCATFAFRRSSASMKPCSSPSSTAWGLPTSCDVRWSFTRLS